VNDPLAEQRARLGAALAAAGLPFVGLAPLRPSGSVWRAHGPTGAWTVRLARAGEDAALHATLAWASGLAREGLPVPQPWTRARSAPTLVNVGTSVALVTTWSHGTAIAERGWDDATAEALGRLLARLHDAAARLPASSVAGARRYDATWAEGAWDRLDIARVLPDLPPREATLVRAGLAAARVTLDAAWHGGPGGPVVVVHGDVHAQNVLEVGRAGDDVDLALIDLDRVGLAPVLLDLTFALLEHEESTAWALWRGYRSVRAVEPAAEGAVGAMRVLAVVDNLAFLAGDEREHAYVRDTWPLLVAACSALLSSARAA
jgi:Ser/Thr protein kinase RdoA (MazF antagonist)